MENQPPDTLGNEDKSRRYAIVAAVLFLLLALLSALGAFVVSILGGVTAYFAFLYLYHRPRVASSPFSNPIFSKQKSYSPSSQNLPEQVKRIIQIAGAVIGFIFFAGFMIGMLSDEKTGQASTGSESETILQTDPNNVDALTATGNQFYDQSNYDSALSYYDKILKLDPRNSIALYNEGLVYYSQKDYLKSIEFLRTCLQIDSSNKDAILFMGHNYYDRQEYDEAFTWYNRAYEAGLRDAFLSHALAYLYDEKKNNTSQAIIHYKEALEMDSSRVDIYTRLAELEPGKAAFYKKKEAQWK
jgi:tetratricopeptide (TPR) repeat protein